MISQQLMDFDLKLEGLHCAFNKANLSNFMDNIIEKLKEIRAVSAPAVSVQPSVSKQSQCNCLSDDTDLNLLPPPPPEWVEEDNDCMELKNIILCQQNKIDLLNEVLEQKTSQIEDLASNNQKTHENLLQLEFSLASYKGLCAEKDVELSTLQTKSAEWDIHASKQANQLQYAEEEIIGLKGDIKHAEHEKQKLAQRIVDLQNENLALKRESHNLKTQLAEQRLAKSSSK